MEDNVIFCETPEEVAEAAAEIIFDKQTEAVADRGVFRIALSGGTTPKLLYQRLASSEWCEEMSWDHWEVFWSDERAVPPDDPNSNFHLARAILLRNVPINKIFPMFSPSPAGGQGEADSSFKLEVSSLPLAARAYEQLLKRQFGSDIPVFDVILLGVGRDGHTASLFPQVETTTRHSPSGGLESTLVAAVTVDHSIPHRLTLTYPVLNAARSVVFLITGEEKAEAVRGILNDGDPSLPATLVKPESGECFWILDDAAAHLLP